MIVVRVSGVADFAELGVRWRDLEQRATGSFFQSWTWTGCLAAERFPNPVLAEATENGRTVALALFNRTGRRVGPDRLSLGESGMPELDCPYIEQNGVLTVAGRTDELTRLCLREVASRYDVVLPGVREATVAAVRRPAGLVSVSRSQASPFVDLAGLRQSGGDYLAGRGTNTRQQIRRSGRFYEQAGPVVAQPAGSVAAAHALLDELSILHQAAWTGRGKPGSFAHPFFRRFHQQLIAVAIPRGEAVLLRVSSGGRPIGILYNFVHRGRMLAYQSGFAYRREEPRAKPGLTCHYEAIRMALAQGLDTYEFLAGDDRYKRSLADGAYRQVWAECGPLYSPRLLLRCMLEMRRHRPEAEAIRANR